MVLTWGFALAASASVSCFLTLKDLSLPFINVAFIFKVLQVRSFKRKCLLCVHIMGKKLSEKEATEQVEKRPSTCIFQNGPFLLPPTSWEITLPPGKPEAIWTLTCHRRKKMKQWTRISHLSRQLNMFLMMVVFKGVSSPLITLPQ